MQLSVIIVNYNVKYFLEQCLYSVIKASGNIKSEIFVVDNNSSDGSKDYLAPKFPGVIFKWNADNPGFAKACNSVLNEAKGSHTLFLNPDTIIAEDTLEKAIDFLRKHTDAGALGVRMIDGSGRFLKESKRSFPFPSTALFKMTGLAKLFPRSKTFARYYAPHIPEGNSQKTEVLAGAFMMLTEKALAKVKGFDEDFFMYGEDIDLSYRIIKAGFKNYYFAGSTIIHFKGESIQKNSPGYIRNFYDSMKLFVAKHYSEKKTAAFFIQRAIWLSKLLASFRSTGKTKSITISRSKSTIVVSSHSHFNELIPLLQQANDPVMLAGRVSVNEADTGSSIGRIDSLKEIVTSHKVGQVVFCEGDITFKDIIRYCQLINGTSLLFHAKGSSSIVGSSNKNQNGFSIAMPVPGSS